MGVWIGTAGYADLRERGANVTVFPPPDTTGRTLFDEIASGMTPRLESGRGGRLNSGYPLHARPRFRHMMTQTVEYALRAVTTLSSYDGASATTEGLAERTKVPVAYLAKILQGLAKAGLIRTQRGVGGGVALAKPPAEVSILEVVSAVEPIRRYKECPLGLHGTALCPLHSRLDAALAALEAAFAATTLADLLADPNPNKPLCAVPVAGVHPNGVPGATVRVPLGIKGKK